ncbi:MAG: cell wall hydrolase [Bacillota bacterium]
MKFMKDLKRPMGVIMLLATFGLLAAGAWRPLPEQDAKQAGRKDMQINRKQAVKEVPTVAKKGITGDNLENKDILLLARAIHSEARGEPFRGQVAVGAVILNRTSDPKFPESIPGVVYQPGAFTAVSDGQINLPPDPTSIMAAEEALKGWDPSGGALYYYNPAKSTSAWIFTRPVINRIGQHTFAL